MKKTERFAAILSLLNCKKYLSVEELSGQLFVSASTLRRDLAEMSRSGYLIRTRGGAMALTPEEAEETVIHHPGETLSAAQDAIARRAASLIQDGDMIYLDTSRLILGMAAYLREKKRLTIVTNSLQLALTLPEGRHRLISLGGELAARNMSVTGRLAIAGAERFNYRLAIFACSGLSNGYITCRSAATASLMERVAQRAERRALLCPRAKAERVTAVNALPVSQMDVIITDAPEYFPQAQDRVICP